MYHTRQRTSAVVLASLVICLSGQADDSSKKLDPKSAEANLRKAQEAVKNTDSTLQWLSKALYAGSVLTKNPDLKEASRFTDDLRKTTGELKKHTDKVVELAERKKDQPGAEKESKSLLEKVKLVRIGNQADELERLARKVRDLPIGLVSEKIDDKFVVSADLLVKDPKQAESRFKSYVAALKSNAEYLKAKHDQLDEAGKMAKGAGVFLSRVQSDVEKAIPFSGTSAKPLTEFYLDLDKLIKSYHELATECAAKARLAKHAADVEQRRHDQLKETVKTLFGFRL